MKSIAIIIFLSIAVSVTAQDLLDLSSSRFCQYTGEALPEELYAFPSDESIEGLAGDILRLTGKPANFKLLAANVTTAAAVYSAGKRYLMYNRLYFNDLNNNYLKAGILAHLIGHHINGHTFALANQAEEEVAADEFMGYALCKLGVAREHAASIPQQLSLAQAGDPADRIAAILCGWERAEAHLKINPGTAFYEDDKGQIDPSFPQFPFPPPEWSESRDLSSFFIGSKTLGEIEGKLVKALDANGYFSRSYFQVPNGFTLATRLEQIQPDGTSMPDKNRWSVKPVREEAFSVANYLKSLLVSQPGFFRVFVFVVTDKSIYKNPKYRVSREEAINWLSEGGRCLPGPLVRQKVSSGVTKVTALVYEFEVSESNGQAKLHHPAMLTGEAHLRKAKLISILQK